MKLYTKGKDKDIKYIDVRLTSLVKAWIAGYMLFVGIVLGLVYASMSLL